MLNNFDYISTQKPYDKWLNRKVHRTKFWLKQLRFKFVISLRWLYFSITRKQAAINSFKPLEIPMRGLPVSLYVDIKNALYFEIKEKRYRAKTNVVFLHKDNVQEEIHLKVVGAFNKVEHILPLEYLQLYQPKRDLTTKQKFELKSRNLLAEKLESGKLTCNSLSFKKNPISYKTRGFSIAKTTTKKAEYDDFKAFVNQLELIETIPLKTKNETN